MPASLLAGAVVGLSVAAPFGPVSLVCVQQSLSYGYRHGLMAGCGSATAHGIFATIAVLGADAAAQILTPAAGAIQLFSALILIALGIRVLVRARSLSLEPRASSLRSSYASALMLALSNPMTIIPYLAMATVNAQTHAAGDGLCLGAIPGVMGAAACWYSALSVATSALRQGVPTGLARVLNLVGGCSMIAFGANIGRNILWEAL